MVGIVVIVCVSFMGSLLLKEVLARTRRVVYVLSYCTHRMHRTSTPGVNACSIRNNKSIFNIVYDLITLMW